MSITTSSSAPVKLNWDAMPGYVKDDIFKAAYNGIQEFMKRPDAQELLDAERERLLSIGSTLLEPKQKKLKASPEIDAPAERISEAI